MRTLLAFAVLLTLCCASLGHAQSGYQSTQVVVGQTPDGQNRVIAVIPLKFMDPAVAAELFGGLSIPGSAMAFPSQGSNSPFNTRNGFSNRGRNNNFGDNSNANASGYDGRRQNFSPFQNQGQGQGPYDNNNNNNRFSY